MCVGLFPDKVSGRGCSNKDTIQQCITQKEHEKLKLKIIFNDFFDSDLFLYTRNI